MHAHQASDEHGKADKFHKVEKMQLSPFTNDASYPIDCRGADGLTYSMMLHTRRVENLPTSALSNQFSQNDKEDALVVTLGETKNACKTRAWCVASRCWIPF